MENVDNMKVSNLWLYITHWWLNTSDVKLDRINHILDKGENGMHTSPDKIIWLQRTGVMEFNSTFFYWTHLVDRFWFDENQNFFTDHE